MPLAPIAIGSQTLVVIRRRHQIAVVIDPARLHFRRYAMPISIDIGGEFRTMRVVARQPFGADFAGDGFDVAGGRGHDIEDTIFWCNVPYGITAFTNFNGHCPPDPRQEGSSVFARAKVGSMHVGQHRAAAASAL